MRLGTSSDSYHNLSQIAPCSFVAHSVTFFLPAPLPMMNPQQIDKQRDGCVSNPVVKHLAHVLLFSSTDDNGTPLDTNYSICDFDVSDLDRLYLEFQTFIDKAEELVTAKVGGDWETLEDFYLYPGSDGCVEHDFIFTRNRHGVGFWENGRWLSPVGEILDTLATSFAEVYCYVGDDGKLHIA